MNRSLGISMILIFCFSQAFRDVYLGHVFQRVDFFAVILLAFIPSTLFFGAIAWWRYRDEIRALPGHWPTLAAMNVATALAWTSYFFGLSHLEPVIVNTLHSGIAPLTVIVLSAAGFSFAGKHATGKLEAVCLAGMMAALAGLWWLVLNGSSGIGGQSASDSLMALCLLLVSGASITISHLFAKTLSTAGLGAVTITASRYFLIVLMAIAFLLARDVPSGIQGAGHGIWLGIAAALLIALPLYALQIGIAHTPQLMAHILRALGPVFVFALQQFDGRLAWSMPVLTLVLLYSIFIGGANIAHGRSHGQAVRKSPRP
jgi:drug/metabolite transporter (DMT)-like permease